MLSNSSTQPSFKLKAPPKRKSQHHLQETEDQETVDDDSNGKYQVYSSKYPQRGSNKAKAFDYGKSSQKRGSGGAGGGAFRGRLTARRDYLDRYDSQAAYGKYSEENKKFKYAEQESKKVELKFNLPEDTRISKLLRRLSVEEDAENSMQISRKLLEVLLLPDNAAYVKKSFNILRDSILQILYVAPGLQAKKQCARAFGRMGYILAHESYDFSKYLKVILKPKIIEEETVCLYMESLKETLKLDREKQILDKNSVYYLMNDLINLIENTDNVDIFQAVLNNLIDCVEFYPNNFFEFFKDSIDVLFGWHVDHTQPLSNIEFISHNLIRISSHFQMNLDFSLTLIVNFIEDIETYGNQIVKNGDPNNVEHVTVFILALNTVLQCLNKGEKEQNDEVFSGKLISDAITKIATILTKTLPFLLHENLIIAGNKSLSLLLELLSVKNSALVELILKLVDCELAVICEMNNPGIISCLLMISKIIKELSANLPIDLIRKLVGPKSQLIQLRSSPFEEIQEGTICVYQALLNLKNIPLLQEAYKYILSDLEVAFKVINPEIGSLTLSLQEIENISSKIDLKMFDGNTKSLRTITSKNDLMNITSKNDKTNITAELQPIIQDLDESEMNDLTINLDVNAKDLKESEINFNNTEINGSFNTETSLRNLINANTNIINLGTETSKVDVSDMVGVNLNNSSFTVKTGDPNSIVNHEEKVNELDEITSKLNALEMRDLNAKYSKMNDASDSCLNDIDKLSLKINVNPLEEIDSSSKLNKGDDIITKFNKKTKDFCKVSEDDNLILKLKKTVQADLLPDLKSTNEANNINFDLNVTSKPNINNLNLDSNVINIDDLAHKSNLNAQELSMLSENFDKMKALSLYLNQIENLTFQLNPFSSIKYEFEEAGIIALFLLRCLSQLANASGSIIGMWALKPSILELLGVLLQPYNKKLERIPGLQFSLIFLLYSHCKCYNFFVSSSDLVKQKSTIRTMNFSRKVDVLNMNYAKNRENFNTNDLVQDVTKSPNSGNFSIILDGLYKIFKYSDNPEILLLALKWSNEIFAISEPYLEILYTNQKFLNVVKIMIVKCGYMKDKDVVLGVGDNLEKLLGNKHLSWKNCFLKEINKLCVLRMGDTNGEIKEMFTKLFTNISWDVSVLEIGNLHEGSACKENIESDEKEDVNECDGFNELADIMGEFYECEKNMGSKNTKKHVNVQNNLNVAVKNKIEQPETLQKEEVVRSSDIDSLKEAKERKAAIGPFEVENDNKSKIQNAEAIVISQKDMNNPSKSQSSNCKFQMQQICKNPVVLQRFQRMADINFNFKDGNATSVFLQALRERNVYKKEDHGGDLRDYNSLTIFKAQQLHINGVLYGEILPHHFATFMDYVLKNGSPGVHNKENTNIIPKHKNATSDVATKIVYVDSDKRNRKSSTQSKLKTVDSMNFLKTIFSSSWPLESENQDLSDEFREVCTSSQEVLCNWITWESAQYCVNNKLRTTLGKPNETFTSFENCLKKLAKEIMTKHQTLSKMPQDETVQSNERGWHEKTSKTDQDDDLKTKPEHDSLPSEGEASHLKVEDNVGIKLMKAKHAEFEDEVHGTKNEEISDDSKMKFGEVVKIKERKDLEQASENKHGVKILQDDNKVKIQQKEVKILQQKNESKQIDDKQDIKILQQKEIKVEKEEKSKPDVKILKDDKAQKEGKNQQKEKDNKVQPKNQKDEVFKAETETKTLEKDCKKQDLSAQALHQCEEDDASRVDIKRVHLLLTFIDHLEKLIYNAAEGSAFAIPQPSKPVRTFFTTNSQTCKDWLSRIRIILIQLSLHAGQNVLALRHGQELIKDFVNTNKQDNIDFKRVVMYVTLALLNLKESEAIYGLYVFCKNVAKQKFSWVKAASDQALNKFEIAAKSYEKIVSELKEDVYVMNFISDQIINCYKELNDWKEIVDYKNGNMNLIFAESENGLRYSFNTVNFECANALHGFELDDAMNRQSALNKLDWQKKIEGGQNSKILHSESSVLQGSKSLQDVHEVFKKINADSSDFSAQNFHEQNIDEQKYFSRSFSDGSQFLQDFEKLKNPSEYANFGNLMKTLQEVECPQIMKNNETPEMWNSLHEQKFNMKNFDLSLLETQKIQEFYPALIEDKLSDNSAPKDFQSCVNIQAFNELSSWKELELQNSSANNSWSVYDALNITESNLYNIALNMKNPLIHAKPEQLKNPEQQDLLRSFTNGEERVKLQYDQKQRLLNRINDSLKRIRIFMQDNITHLPSLFLKDFSLLNYVANGLKNVINQKPASVVFLVSEDFENEVDKIDSSSLSKILWWSEYFAKIQNQGFNTFSSNLRLNIIKKARKENNHNLATTQLFKFLSDKSLLNSSSCGKSDGLKPQDFNLRRDALPDQLPRRKSAVFLVDLADNFKNKIPEINLWTLDMAKAAQEMIKLLYNEKHDSKCLSKQRHDSERFGSDESTSRFERERRSSFNKEKSRLNVDETERRCHSEEKEGRFYEESLYNHAGKSYYSTQNFRKMYEGNESYKKLAFDLCAISTTSISKCADIYGGTELKQVSSKILLKLATWLQNNHNEVSLTEINTPLGKFLSVLPEIGTDYSNINPNKMDRAEHDVLNFQTNQFNIGENLIPINEMMIGKLLQFSVNQCQNLAKNWNAFGTWCYRWGKKIVDNSSDLTNTLTEDDKKMIRSVIPEECTEEEFQRILMILSQTRNHVDDEDIDNNDVKTSEMIRNQLKNVSVLSRRRLAENNNKTESCNAESVNVLSGNEEGFWKLQEQDRKNSCILKKYQNMGDVPVGGLDGTAYLWKSKNFMDVSSSGSAIEKWMTKPVESVLSFKTDLAIENSAASIEHNTDAIGSLENLQHLRSSGYDTTLSDEANLKNWRKAEKANSACPEMSTGSSGYTSEKNWDKDNFEATSAQNCWSTELISADDTNYWKDDMLRTNEMKWTQPKTSQETIDHLVQIWKNLQKRIYAYYGLSVEAYFKYLHLTSNSENITKATEANTVTVTLRLLRLIVKHALELQNCLEEGLAKTPTQPWKIIIPQLFSRLNHPESFVRERVSELLCRVAEDSPHLITFPAVVGALEGGVKFDFSEISLPKNCLSQKNMKDCFMQSNGKQEVEDDDNKKVLSEIDEEDDDDDEEEEEIYESDDDCKDILQSCFKSMVETLSKKTPETIKQVKLLVKELRRIILLWDELWLGTLAQHHGEIQKRQQQLELEIEKVNNNKNLNNEEKISLITEKHRIILKPIIFILEQLNEITSVEPETPHERQFQERFSKSITEVLLRLKNPEHPERPQESWKLLKDLQNQFQQKSHKTRNLLKMQEISPILSNITNTLISMPGQTLRRKVYIQKVSSQVSILPTKTKPKKLIFYGSDGKTYIYLFKGLEDLHLDERIMQFLSITNKLLAQNSEGTGHNLYRARHYSVIPLGPRSGLISWVSGTTPVFSLYKRWQQREAQKLNNAKNPQILRPSELFYNKLNPLLQEQGIKNLDNRKEWPLAVLKQVLAELMTETPSDLLSKELWLNSINPKNYWQVVKKYNYSVAVMSIIGYVIGLGDRHLDNVLVDLSTGEVVHIDYNVCFEKGKTLRVPEKVPFRLTPNIRDALGVTGIEGMFRLACEHILKTMKKGRETLLTLLEAFVYDPLVDWTVGNDGLVGTTFGGISTNTTHKKQTRKDLEKEVTLAMYRVRCTEMKTDWDQNRDDILKKIPQMKNLLNDWVDTNEKLTQTEDSLHDLHQQMALVKEAEANGIYKDSLHTLPVRYENFRQQQEAANTAKKDLDTLLKDSELHIEKFSESIKYLQNQQMQQFYAELGKNNDAEKIFELVKEFLQNAGQVGMIQQCDTSENEVLNMQEQQNVSTLKCLNLLQEYWMVYSQCPQSYLENHRLFYYMKWLTILKNSSDFQTCENVLQQFYTFANLSSISKQSASSVLKFSYLLNILYNQALAQAQKTFEELNKMRQEGPVLMLEKHYADSKICLAEYLRHEKNGPKALEFVILSELLVLNRTFLTLETAASKSGDWLIKLTSREGDWFLDELTLNSSKAIELISYLTIVDSVENEDELMKVVNGLNAANNVYKALHELNFNFHTIILPESMKKIQSEEASVVDMVKDLRAIILGLGLPLQDLVVQLEKELTCVVMEMDHSPTYDIIQAKLITLKLQFQNLLQHTNSSEMLTPGKMLLMGFNGLFEKLNLESNNIINTLGQVQIPQCWRKLDQVKDAKSLTTPIFNQEVKKIIEDIFLLKRINAMYEFFAMCTEMCKSFQKGQDFSLFAQISENKLENSQLGFDKLQENVVIFNDEQLIKPIRKYIADFISKQFLGVTTEAIAYVICFLLQRLGLNVTKEIEQKDIGAENKVPLEELYHKGWNLFIKNGLFNQNILAETSTIQSNVKSAWEKIQKPKMMEKTVALMQSSVQRLQNQLSAHFWIHEDLLTLAQNQEKNNFMRSKFLTDLHNKTNNLKSLQLKNLELREKQKALIGSITQRLKWAAGANPDLTEIISAFEAALQTRDSKFEIEQKISDVTVQTCLSILKHEILRNNSAEAKSYDQLFLNSYQKWVQAFQFSNMKMENVTKVEENIMRLYTKDLVNNPKWIKIISEKIGDVIKATQKESSDCKQKLEVDTNVILSGVCDFKSSYSEHCKIMLDFKNLIKSMSKIEESSLKSQQFIANYRDYIERFTNVIHRFKKDCTNLTPLDVESSLRDLVYLETNTEDLYAGVLELEGKRFLGLSGGDKRKLVRQDGVSLSPMRLRDLKQESMTRGQQRNAYAVNVWRRIRAKLEGRDPDPGRRYTTQEQVDYVIREATSLDNLCLLYEGWTPWV